MKNRQSSRNFVLVNNPDVCLFDEITSAIDKKMLIIY